MGLLHPELLLLLLPAAFALWATRSPLGPTNVLRAAVALLLVLALCGPYLRTPSRGRDLVVVVDRSRSMPAQSQSSALELMTLAEKARQAGDRVAVVSFGARPEIERIPREEGRFAGFQAELDRDGSDLAAALDEALALLPQERSGSLLLISDGETTGRDPLPVARRAFARDVRIDVRAFPRPSLPDLSIERIDLPGEVAVGEPFQFHVWVRSDRRVETEFSLQRGTRTLSSGRRVFEAGLSRLVFRDVLERTGVAEYAVSVAGDADRVPENDRGLGAVMARGAPALLVLNEDGSEDSLVRALRSAGMPVAVTTPEAARLDAVGLSGFRAVLLENVAASRLGRNLSSLRSFVLDRGGGLLVSGGRASFGIGGYFLSPLDEVLPVSMELRQEHRKMAVALAVVLDRSGSMSAPVGGGMTKMDLANLGTAAAIELLSPMDSVTVIAVDSSPHIIQPLTAVVDAPALSRTVRGIESMGGGIFTYTGLAAATRELTDAPQQNRHITLFSDAADSEEQEGCHELVAELAARNTTLSVIALGTELDSDAQFLKDIASIGGGEAYFTQDPSELPRLFAMDTMTASRSTFVEERTAVATLPGLLGLGSVDLEGFPSLPGYNLCYLREGAQAGVVTADEYRAPLLAFWQAGLGRSAAYTGQIGGTYGAELVAWDGFASLIVTLGRWLVGNEEPGELFPSVQRDGRDVVVRVEVDPDSPVPPDTGALTARLANPDGSTTQLTLERVSEHLFEARTPLAREGVVLGSVDVGQGRVLSLPPMALPYSPEFERSPDPRRGERLLASLAQASGGEVGVSAERFFRGPRTGRLWRLVSRELLALALLLFLVEIAGRRLSLWGSLGRWSGLARWSRAARKRLRRAAPASKPATAPGPKPVPAHAAAAQAQPATPAPTDASTPSDVGGALARARRAADRKLGR